MQSGMRQRWHGVCGALVAAAMLTAVGGTAAAQQNASDESSGDMGSVIERLNRNAVSLGTQAATRFFGEVWKGSPSPEDQAQAGSDADASAQADQTATSVGRSEDTALEQASVQSGTAARLPVSERASAFPERAADSDTDAAASPSPSPSTVTEPGAAAAAPLAAYPHGSAMWGAQALAAWRATFAGPGPSGVPPREPRELPEAVVRDLLKVVLEVGRHAESLGFQGRRSRLDSAVRDTFHLAGMAQFAVGDHWYEMTPLQRSALTESFSRILVAMFADRFDFYYDHTFEVADITRFDDATVRVDTDLVLPIGHRVRIAYVLRPIDGRWQIIDVLPPPGYSEAFARRDEYLSVIDRRGLRGFFSALETMVASLESR